MNTLTEETLNELEALQKRATPGPWQECGHNRGGCQCCQIWSQTADAPVAETTRGKWGDAFPTLKGVAGDSLGSIGCKVEAVMEMIEYGEIPEGVGEANAAFISKMENHLPALISSAREALRLREKLDKAVTPLQIYSECGCTSAYKCGRCRVIDEEILDGPKDLHPPASGITPVEPDAPPVCKTCHGRGGWEGGFSGETWNECPECNGVDPTLNEMRKGLDDHSCNSTGWEKP